MIRSVLGSRASIGGVLGSGRGGAAAWYLAGGVSAANCVAAYAPKGAASLAASYTNLANPGTYNAAPGVAPTWDTTGGWDFNGTQYLKTGVVPAANYSAIARYSDWSYYAGQNCLVGMTQDAARRFALVLLSVETKYDSGGTLTVSEGGAQPTEGIIAVTSAAGYRSGSPVGSLVGTWSGTTTYECYIGARNYLNGINIPVDAKIQAVAIYNVTLSAATVAALSAAMAAL